jgi:VWFA-related protein
MKRAACVLACAGLATTYAYGPSQQPGVKTTTAGVLIDVTVADNKGQPVLDLALDDFEVTEEGKRQKVLSVTLVQGGVARAVTGRLPAEMAPGQPAPETAATGSSNQAPAVENTPTVTAILFDRLSPEAMPYAVRAALAYVSTLTPPHDYAGVFVADLKLNAFQRFTTDQSLLRGAVERFGATAPAKLRPETQRAGDVFIQKLDPGTPITVGAEERGGAFASIAEREDFLKTMAANDRVQYLMTMMVMRMETGYRQLLSEYEGQYSVAALRAVVDALALAGGRKSILYFTENLPLADRLKAKFDEVIGQANRANITFYPVDAAGLRLHSKEAELARDVKVAGAQSIGDEERPIGPWTKELERQDQLLVSRPTAVLGRLAKETGGFVIENTNDLGAGVGRMKQERTTYYLLGYQPTKATMDGKFRRVSVKVKRPKVSVRARPGYLAIPPPSQ